MLVGLLFIGEGPEPAGGPFAAQNLRVRQGLVEAFIPAARADIEPELGEMKRACIFGADELDDAGVIGKVVETLPDKGAVQIMPGRIGGVIELFGEEDAFIARIGGRFGEAGIIDIVCRAPGEVGVVGAGFDDIMLEIVLM